MWRLTPRAAVFIAAVALLVVLAFWVGGYQASRPLRGRSMISSPRSKMISAPTSSDKRE